MKNSEYDSAPAVEPEDDHTPTPSISSGAGQPWETATDSVLEPLDGETSTDDWGQLSSQRSSIAESDRAVVNPTHQHRRHGSKDGEESVWDMAECHVKGSSELETQNDPSDTTSEDHSNKAYKVVRKGKRIYFTFSVLDIIYIGPRNKLDYYV